MKKMLLVATLGVGLAQCKPKPALKKYQVVIYILKNDPVAGWTPDTWTSAIDAESDVRAYTQGFNKYAANKVLRRRQALSGGELEDSIVKFEVLDNQFENIEPRISKPEKDLLIGVLNTSLTNATPLKP